MDTWRLNRQDYLWLWFNYLETVLVDVFIMFVDGLSCQILLFINSIAEYFTVSSRFPPSKTTQPVLKLTYHENNPPDLKSSFFQISMISPDYASIFL